MQDYGETSAEAVKDTAGTADAMLTEVSQTHAWLDSMVEGPSEIRT